eukprot:6271623-Amphidinium_carterae.1
MPRCIVTLAASLAVTEAELDMAPTGDTGCVELATRHVKQDAALGRQRDELHLVGHTFGVTGVP